MYTFQQSTGELTRASDLIDIGYSGHGVGINRSQLQTVKLVGPIPTGQYTIGAAENHPHLGPLSMPLTPAAGTLTFGRSGFFIHGDNALGNHSGSEGCIVLARITREEIAQSGDHTLLVIP